MTGLAKRIGLAASAIGLATAGTARVAIIITATEANGDVVIKGGGSLDLTGLTP